MKSYLMLLFPLLFTSFYNNNNQPSVVAGEYDELFQVIKNKLEGKCVGYQVTISHDGQNPTSFSGGYARLPQDAPELKMYGNVKFHTASVSKTITAIALMNAIEAIRPIEFVASSITPFLPRHWKIHETMRTITFHQLLTHKSGIRNDFGVDYHGLKKLFETGISPADKNVEKYHNANYGIMRLLIPVLARKNVTQLESANGSAGIALEMNQALQYATFYQQYVQENVFNPAAVSNVPFKIPLLIGGLCYQFPLMNRSGEAFGDAFLTAGSHGWVLSSQELDKIMSTFYYTNTILAAKTRSMMMEREYGFSWKATNKGYKYLSKGGYYPGSINDGELHTWVIHFEQGYDMSIIINSPYLAAEGQSFFEAAFDEWYKPAIKKVIDKKIFNKQ